MTLSATLIICIITCLISWQAFERERLMGLLIDHPYTVAQRKEYYRWLTSGFVHANVPHLAINMFVFYQFGGIVENLYVLIFGPVLGLVYFILMYFCAIIFSSLPSFYRFKTHSNYYSLGASGGVSAVMLTFALFYPFQEILFMAFIPMYAIVWAFLYLLYEQWASRNMQDNVGHDAHFYGALVGVVFTVVLKPEVGLLFIEQVTEFIQSL